MKKIISYLKTYYLNEFKWSYVLTMMGLLGIAIYFNYGYHFKDGYGLEDHFVDKYYHSFKHFVRYVLFYGAGFIAAYLLYAVFYKKYDFLKRWDFWLLALFALAVFSMRVSVYWHKDWVDTVTTAENYKYWHSTLNNMVGGMFIFIPIFLYWLFFDRTNSRAFGFQTKGVDFKPYWVMLGGMVILISYASTRPEFLEYYPRAMRSPIVNADSAKGIGYFLFYELWYGFDFIFIEHFFRGFLVLAFAKYVGRGAIIPMVTFYVLIHFGKPMMETVSSFFGGLILGVIAYESKSIFGGILIHMGVAWLMEYGAFIGRAFLTNH